MITRIVANINYRTLYRCAACGKKEQGTTASISLESVDAIRAFITSPPQRSHDMPVGWASHLNIGYTCGCEGSPK